MDKWFYKPWFIKVFSLFLSIMLFLIVNIDNTKNQPVGIPGITNGSKVLEDVSLTVYYDEDNYVLTEAPETVQVTLRGPQNILTLLQVRPQYELYIDLRGKEAGVHYEKVQYRDFPSELSVSPTPSTVRVTLQEKQTATFPVEVELLNKGEIQEGYTIGTPSVNPSTVDITAAQGVIEQISNVRAVVDVSGKDATFEETTAVIVLDQSGNQLDINPNPPAVDVTVPITSPNKEVPVRIEREGSLPEGIAIDSITTDPAEVTIYGPVDVINDISFIDGIKVDLSDISENTSLEVDIPLPEGVEQVSPGKVTVNIEVTKEETREFSNIPIDVTGLEKGRKVVFENPEDGVVDIVVMGSPGALERMERGDIQLIIDVEGLEPGKHTVPIQFNGPQNVRLNQRTINVRINIVEAEEADDKPSSDPDPDTDADPEDENTEDEPDGDTS
ncbi:YbbR domain-containing protein [Evansella caseinilytica]|uniref:YbbR domain-containing protein n=1 Tax=Evansella caseinilytica TaxID=1503961 RepID=A0A1H3SI48_9BACI|nr:CdaR family protein [Evansella caseinilytica]SDZ37696.1 YbbR domain-containing protein [Evansella caseinilytica]